MTSYNRLIVLAGLSATIKPGLAVALILFSMILSVVSFSLTGVWSGADPDNIQAILMRLGFDGATIFAAAGMLLHVQPKLNRYWERLPGSAAVGGKPDSGEIISVVIGVLFWVTAALSLILAR